jgi:hypothetical protein
MNVFILIVRWFFTGLGFAVFGGLALALILAVKLWDWMTGFYFDQATSELCKRREM